MVAGSRPVHSEESDNGVWMQVFEISCFSTDPGGRAVWGVGLDHLDADEIVSLTSA
jgi:hypothetical protein